MAGGGLQGDCPDVTRKHKDCRSLDQWSWLPVIVDDDIGTIKERSGGCNSMASYSPISVILHHIYLVKFGWSSEAAEHQHFQ